MKINKWVKTYVVLTLTSIICGVLGGIVDNAIFSFVFSITSGFATGIFCIIKFKLFEETKCQI